MTDETNLHFEIINSSLTQSLQIHTRQELAYFTLDQIEVEITSITESCQLLLNYKFKFNAIASNS